MKIGIFGGSFNPIHIGHLILAEEIRVKANLDKILFVPVGNPSHRENNLLDGEKRIELIKEGIKDNPYFELCDIEIKSGKVNYTYDTFLTLQNIYKEDQLVEVIGEDSADYLHKWKNYEELLKLTKFYVYKRKGYDYKSTHKNIIVCDTKEIEISASEIREKLAFGKSIRYLVPKEVEKIILEKGYYTKEERC